MFIALLLTTLTHAASPQGLTGKSIHCAGNGPFDLKLVRESGPGSDGVGEGYVGLFNQELVNVYVQPFVTRVADGLSFHARLPGYYLEITDVQSSLTPGTPAVGITATLTNTSYTRNAGNETHFTCAYGT